MGDIILCEYADISVPHDCFKLWARLEELKATSLGLAIFALEELQYERIARRNARAFLGKMGKLYGVF